MTSEKQLEKAREVGRNGSFVNEQGLNDQERNALIKARNEGAAKKR